MNVARQRPGITNFTPPTEIRILARATRPVPLANEKAVLP
jgi:hypothetical protein